MYPGTDEPGRQTDPRGGRRSSLAPRDPMSAAMEIAPALGLAGRIVDLVSTGTTLRENGLVETSRILDISARLIVNRAALKTDPRVAALVEGFRADAAKREAA